MEKIRDNKGITLIVLIITIIVLLIIAGISISGAINGIEEADTNRLITELEKVQHAVTERYSKYELTKDASVLVGTKIDLTSLTDVPQSVNWKVLQTTTASQTSTHPERKYYRLSKSDLENLGLTGDYRGSSYIVNYYSGEAYDEAEIQTSDGTVLYKTGIENEASELGDEVIQDGLQVWYDAINNTGSGHSNSTTTWKDLSGNGRDGKLKGRYLTTTTNKWYNNYLRNEWGKWIDLGILNNNYQTLEITFATDSISYQSIFGNWEDGGGGIYIDSEGYLNGEYYIRDGNTYMNYKGIKADEQVETGKKYCVDLTYDGEKIVMYINGQEEGKNDNDTTGIIRNSQSNTVMAIGANPTGTETQGYQLTGNVYCAKIYNRALTAEEVKHNYILDKARYGIE